MTNCLFNLQKSVYGALNGDATLSGSVSGIYTHIPQGSSFPYVHLAVASTDDRSTIETTILEVTLEVHSYSRVRSTEEASGIMDDVKRLLHHQTLSVTGCACLGIRMLDDQLEELADGLTWHGVQRFQVWLHES
jgi:hypothetical protein